MKVRYVTSTNGGKLHCIVWIGKRSEHQAHYFALPEDTDPNELEIAVNAAVDVIKLGHVRISGVDIA